VRRYAVTLKPGDKPVEVEIREEPGEPIGPVRLRIATEAGTRVVDLRAFGAGRYSWLDGSRVVNAEVEPKGQKYAIAVRGEAFVAEVVDAEAAHVPVVSRAGGAAGPTTLRAPMPGRVVKLLAKVGDEVEAGQGVLVVEAMKMENEIKAPRKGRVREIRVSEGAAVESGQELLILE
jgi:biotin carboxyl carrier protein